MGEYQLARHESVYEVDTQTVSDLEHASIYRLKRGVLLKFLPEVFPVGLGVLIRSAVDCEVHDEPFEYGGGEDVKDKA